MIAHGYSVFLIMLALAYLVGGVPTGYSIARWWGIDDIRNHGSGNIGATNVARLLGVPLFFLVFIIDAGKAWLMLMGACCGGMSEAALLAIACVVLLGNCYSPFLGLRGGKGVATSVGIIAFFSPSILFFALCIWVVAFLIIRVVGIASVMTAASVPVLSMVLYPSGWAMLIMFASMSMLIIVRHRTNLRNYIK